MRPKILRHWDATPRAMSSLDGLHEYADRLAQSEQDKRGTCRTQFVIVREKDALIVSTPWENDFEKDLYVEWLRETFATDHNIQRFSYVSEAWVRTPVEGKPGVFGNRTDALLINTQERGCPSRFSTYRVLSGAGRRKKRVLMQENYDRAEGRFVCLFGTGETTSLKKE